MVFAWKTAGITYVLRPVQPYSSTAMPKNLRQWVADTGVETEKLTGVYSYNRYLAVAARVVRRSLKDDKRVQAERRGEMELRFAKWEVCIQQEKRLRHGVECLVQCADLCVCDRTERQAGREQVIGDRQQRGYGAAGGWSISV